MIDCTYLDDGGQVVATISLRQAPTTLRELSVIVDEVFQSEGVNEASAGDRHAYFVPCAHAWTPCRSALAVIREPYFLVISLGSGDRGLARVSALEQQILDSLPG